MGKDSTEVRNPQRKLMPDTVGLEQHKPTSLWEIANKVMVKLCTAEASTTEEPDAVILHVRVCTGGAGQPAFLP
jgi:hypothetical protein